MTQHPVPDFDVLVIHGPHGTETVRSFAERLRRVGFRPWLSFEQLGYDVDPLEGLEIGLQSAQHVGVWLDDELVRQPWLPRAAPLLGMARQRGQRIIAWGSAWWDPQRLGPPPIWAGSIPADLTEDERLWIATCGLQGESPGPRDMWHGRGQALWEQPLWEKEEQAQELVNRGDLYGAAELYSDILDSEPEHVPAQIARGRLYLDLGDYGRAMSDFMTAQDLDPDCADADLAMADLFFARKDYARAIEHYNTALAQVPDQALALTRRGLSLHYRNKHREALADLERAQQIDPDLPNLATLVAKVRRKAR